MDVGIASISMPGKEFETILFGLEVSQ